MSSESWNYHCLSSEHNLTPEQLFTVGMLERESTQNPITNLAYQSVDLASCGMDDVTVVNVPSTSDVLCATLQSELLHVQQSNRNADFGKALYVFSALALIFRLVVNSASFVLEVTV